MKHTRRVFRDKAEEICAEEIGLRNARDNVALKIARAWEKQGRGRVYSDMEVRGDGDILAAPLERVPFWVVDVETTGLKAPHDRVIEVAAVEVSNLRTGRIFSSLIRQDAPLSPFIISFTGITDHMLSQAPPPESVFSIFFRMIRGGVIVAHNAGFDCKFLEAEHGRDSYGGTLSSERVCTVRLARRMLPDLQDHKLETLARHYRMRFGKGETQKARHRALGDAAVTARIFIRFIRSLRLAGVMTLADLKSFESMPLRKAREILG